MFGAIMHYVITELMSEKLYYSNMNASIKYKYKIFFFELKLIS